MTCFESVDCNKSGRREIPPIVHENNTVKGYSRISKKFMCKVEEIIKGFKIATKMKIKKPKATVLWKIIPRP